MAENPSTTVPVVAAGSTVTYLGKGGKPRVAIVVGTPDNIGKSKRVEPLSEGQLYLARWSFSWGAFVATGPVPHLSQVEGDIEFQDSKGRVVNAWTLA